MPDVFTVFLNKDDDDDDDDDDLQWRIQGRGPGGRPPSPFTPTNFYAKLRHDGPQKLLVETRPPSQGLDDPPPPPTPT